MKISVIVPVYNAERYLSNCIDSLVEQTFHNLEIILVDDGSADSSPVLCDEYATKDSRIKVIHKKNGGSVSARKAGFCACDKKANYVTFVDADDWLDKNYFSNVITQIGALYPDVIKAPLFYFAEEGAAPAAFNSGMAKGYYNRAALEKDLLPNALYRKPFFTYGVCPSLWSVFIKPEKIEKYILSEPDDIALGDDLAVTVPSLAMANDVFVTDVCGYYYRQTPSSITHTYKAKAAIQLNTLLNYLGEVIKEDFPGNMRFQVAAYAANIVYNHVTSIIKNSKDIRTDLDTAMPLLHNHLLTEGMKGKIPFKVRFIINVARKNRLFVLRCVRKALGISKDGAK